MKCRELFIFLLFAITVFGCKEDEPGKLELVRVFVGPTEINLTEPITENLPLDRSITLVFSEGINQTASANSVVLKKDGLTVNTTISFSDNTIVLFPVNTLSSGSIYTLELSEQLKGVGGESFSPMEVSFKTALGDLLIVSLEIGGSPVPETGRILDTPLDFTMTVHFSLPVDETSLNNAMSLSGPNAPSLESVLSDNNQTASITGTAPLKYLNYTPSSF